MSHVDAALTLLRVVVGLTLVAHGLNHWLGGGRIDGTARWFESLGLRHGRIQAWASVVTETGAGVLLVLGLATPLACAAVVSVMAVAGLLAHRVNGYFVFKDGYEYVLVLAVTAIALAMLGPGRASLDSALDVELTGWAAGAIAGGVGLAGTAVVLAATWRPISVPGAVVADANWRPEVVEAREVEDPDATLRSGRSA